MQSVRSISIIAAAGIFGVAGLIWALSDGSSPAADTQQARQQQTDIVGTSTHATSTVSAQPATSTMVSIDGTAVRAEIARTPAERRTGLSDHAELADGEGMLFLFEESARHGFWMKDMAFSIDIVWLSEAGEIVDIAHSVPPETYPQSFTPSEPARYVLEVPAGFARAHEWRPGMKADFGILE